MQWSHSRIKCFQQCPLKYKLKYIDGLKPRVQSVEGYLGKLVHKSLEKLYTGVKEDKTPTLIDILHFYNHSWNRNWNRNIEIVKKENGPEHYRRKGQRFLQDYYHKHHPFNGAETVALEKFISINLEAGGGIMVRGIIDRLSKTEDGTYQVHDYKTSSRLPTKADLRQSRQLPLYALFVKDEYGLDGSDCVELVWHYLAHKKEFRLTCGEADIEAAKENLIENILEVKKAEEFPPHPSALCNWCGFKYDCPECQSLV